MKKLFSVALVLALLLSCVPTVFAADPSTPADDPVIPEIVAACSLTFSGTTANCSGSVTEPGKYIVATMTLTHTSTGTVVGSWSGRGTTNVVLNGSCTVVKGQQYSLVISGTAGGVSFSTTPYTSTC